MWLSGLFDMECFLFRYEEEDVDKWHGYFKNHVITDYFNFKANDADLDDFKIYKNCKFFF